MRYQPLGDRVLLRSIKKGEQKTDSGIIIDTIKKETIEAEVVAAGEGIYASETGQFIPCMVRKGDIVLCAAYDGKIKGLPVDIETESGTEEVFVLREGDCIMVISKKSDS